VSAIPTKEPEVITAGDTVKWTRQYGDYPASAGWQLSYYLRVPNQAPKVIAFATEITASGDSFAVVIPASTSANFTQGNYKWAAFVTKGEERFEVGTGVMLIKPNLATNTPTDDRSHVQKVYEALCAVIENRATADDQSYTIGGRSLTRMTVRELLDFKKEYGTLLAQERGIAPKFYAARFSRP
jgi:hypothetical protein